MTKNKELVKLLIKKGLTVGSIESLTAGLFASTIASVPGSSKILRGSIVTYQSSFKTSILGIKKDDIEKYGVVSKNIAEQMAFKGFKKLNTDIVISFTGNAGPSKEKGNANVGDVYTCIYAKNKSKTIYKNYKGTRNTIRKNVVGDAILEIISFVSKNFS